MELFYANQNKITKWTDDFLKIISTPSHKENLKMYSFGELE